MGNIVDYLIPLMLIGVVVVLVLGLWTMLRGGRPGKSQNLMRWRIILQAVAVIIIIAAIYFTGR
jgi:uncharacterized membrane protein